MLKVKGIYVLVISVYKNIEVNVGALGGLSFEKGIYAYVGSAQTNFDKRIRRHLTKIKKKFWHIDYLHDVDSVKLRDVFYKQAEKFEECRTANEFAEKWIPIKGFGSSDCKCESHLFRFQDSEALREFSENMTSSGWMLLRENGWCVWITGLPGSGKSVVSLSLLGLLKKRRVHAQLLASDALRKVLTPKPTYSLEERDIVYNTLVYIAQLLTENGVNVIIDATGNLKRYRQNARERIPRFIETYLKCPLIICVEREAKRGKTYQAPKQIYAKALKGKAPTVPGIGQPYEQSVSPEITVDTTEKTPEQSAQTILELIVKRFC